MSEVDLTPALTKEEWTQLGRPYDSPDDRSYGETVLGWAEAEMQRVTAGDVRHAVVAVANHYLPDAHPGKITADDVDALFFDLAKLADLHNTPPASMRVLYKLAALLPTSGDRAGRG